MSVNASLIHEVSIKPEFRINIDLSDVLKCFQNFTQYITPFFNPTHPVVPTSRLESKSIRAVFDTIRQENFPSQPPTLVEISEGNLFPGMLLRTCDILSDRAYDLPSRGGNEIQEWGFNVFRAWAPSMDFTWGNLDMNTAPHSHVIAQLGSQDEADSIPVLLPIRKARALDDIFREEKKKAITVKIIGELLHRNHFEQLSKGNQALLEGLDAQTSCCLFLREENEQHEIIPLRQEDAIYSGYLWTCVVPESRLVERKDQNLLLKDLYFIVQHTNFKSQKTIDLAQEMLRNQEEYIRKYLGEEMILVQKLASWVEPERQPLVSSEQFRKILFATPEKI